MHRKGALYMDTLISIVIPIFNQESYLEECLDSICHQSEQDIEIICVDDGSTDLSLEILHKYMEQDPRIRIFSQTNQGAGAARNLGMKHARGKYLLFLDSDDIFEPDMLEKMVKAAEKDKLDILVCRCDRFDADTNRREDASWSIREERLPAFRPFVSHDITGDFFETFIWWPWDKLFRKEFIDSLGISFQILRTTNDLFFVCAAMLMAKRISTIDDVFVHQRIGIKNSLSATREKSWDNFYIALMALKDFLKANGLYERFKKDFINYCLNFSFWHLDTIEGESYCKLYNALKNGWLQDMEILGHPSDYFYNQENFQRISQVLQTAPEDILFQKIHQLEEKNNCLLNMKNDFTSQLIDTKRQLEQTRNQWQDMNQQLQDKNHEFQCIKESLSFRLGRIMTFFPRKVRDLYRRWVSGK